MAKRVFYFDLLRCVAAIAVIAIHVLAPYRHELGLIAFSDWFSAIVINSASRWAVPVFIMISGALMLSDSRPFELKTYTLRRVSKVVVPFLVWSVFYAYFSGWSSNGYDSALFAASLFDIVHTETYYHLGFFYYFIPLYLVIPFLQLLVRNVDNAGLIVLCALWILSTGLYLFQIDGLWSNSLWLYSGYLILGYLLHQYADQIKSYFVVVLLFGLFCISVSIMMVADMSLNEGAYRVGRWLSYKTLNTVVASSMIFLLCCYLAPKISVSMQIVVSFVSKYSLGIYIIHPVILWPMKTLGWHHGNPLVIIPIWIGISFCGALLISWVISINHRTAWLLP